MVRDVAEILHVVAQVQEIVVGRELMIERAVTAIRHEPDRLDAPTRRSVIDRDADAADTASCKAGAECREARLKIFRKDDGGVGANADIPHIFRCNPNLR